MRDFFQLLFIIGLSAVVFAWVLGLGVPGDDVETGVGIASGEPAAELSGTTTAGVPVNLSDYRGKVVLVDFWATWCGPCVGLLPHTKELIQKYRDKPFAVLGVSADRSSGDLQQFLLRDPLPWSNIYAGASSDLLRRWQITAFPTVVLIDAEGVVRERIVGANPGAIDRAVAELLDE